MPWRSNLRGVSIRPLRNQVEDRGMLPVKRKRYCQICSGAVVGMCPIAQERNPLMTELAAANTSAFRGGCSSLV